MTNGSNTSAIGTASHSIKGIALCLGAMLAFASQDAVTKILVQDLPVAQVVMVRYWVFALFAMVWVLKAGALRRAWQSASPRLQLLRSVLSLAEIALFNVALRYLGLAEAHSLMAMFPLFVIILAVPVLGERIPLACWFAVAIGFIGSLIILRPGLGVFQPQAIIPLSAALCFAGYHVVTRQVSRLGDTFHTNVLYMALIGCGLASVFGVSSWQAPTWGQWGWLALISVLSVAAQLLLVKALEYASASLLQPFNYSLLLFATLIGFGVFGELPDRWMMVGALVVMLSGLYVLLQARRA
ncbi:DMT family transporter [Marinomonas ostreistagni]|uniref:DMT family transporter n=1 Tax=Marinomonas ostreistagni TaxID=359209 RepID=UPI00194EEE64|nr:DMT family transporter [Marinomonas ostreistagni]MBM6549913.1 DMT family transporter [Marinomonas ostreistagni]